MVNSTTSDQEASKWMQFWMEQDLRKNKSFVVIMLLSSAPFLGVILSILVSFAVLSCIFKMRTKYKRRRVTKNVQVLENFLVLYNKTKEERNQREVIIQENAKNRRTSQFSAREFPKNFGLPNEDKVPFNLFKEALVNSNTQADQEVVKIIDKLINPPGPRKTNSPVMELINRLHNISDSVKDRKKIESRQKFGQYDNCGFEDPVLTNTEVKKNLADHGIRIIVEDFDGSNENNCEEC